MDSELCVIDFANVNEAIRFVEETWPDMSESCVEAMMEVQRDELRDDDGWSVIGGVCDICGNKQISFLPTCVYDDGIVGVECGKCENMSVYPEEKNDED